MTIQAQSRAASAIISNARIEAAGIVTKAEN